jgi:hypothetical protein
MSFVRGVAYNASDPALAARLIEAAKTAACMDRFASVFESPSQAGIQQLAAGIRAGLSAVDEVCKELEQSDEQVGFPAQPDGVQYTHARTHAHMPHARTRTCTLNLLIYPSILPSRIDKTSHNTSRTQTSSRSLIARTCSQAQNKRQPKDRVTAYTDTHTHTCTTNRLTEKN